MKKQLTLSIDEEVIKLMKDIAKKQYISASALVTRLVLNESRKSQDTEKVD